MEKTARLYHCVRCSCQVLLCSTCDRGNIYCGQVCARAARTHSCRLAGKRYQKSYSGKLNHAARQGRYRERQIEKVTHQGSNITAAHSPSPPPEDRSTAAQIDISCALHCTLCHKPVAKFLRLGFLHRTSYTSRPYDWSRPRDP